MTAPKIQVELGPEWRAVARRAEHSSFAPQSNALVHHAMGRMADVAKRKIGAALSRHKRGRMRDPKVVVHGSGSSSWIRVATGAGTNLLVAGVHPHRIRAYRRPMPVGGAGGVQRFAEVVEHPGFRGDPYVRRGIAASQGDFRHIERGLLDDLRDLLREG
jgi:hypothetical protein